MNIKKFFGRLAVASMLVGSLTVLPGTDNIAHADDDNAYLIQSYTQEINRNPNDATAYFNRGLAYSSAKKYDDAIKDFSKVISLEPRNVDGYLHRGIAYRESKKYSQALADFNKALELKPNDGVIGNNRADTYYRMKDYEHAIADYNKVIQSAKPYTPSKEELQLAKMGIKIDANPHSKSWAYYGLGLIHFDTKDYKQAIADYTNAMQEFQHSNFYRERSKCYKAIGDSAKANADLKKCRELEAAEAQSLDDLDDSVDDMLEKIVG